MRAIGWTCAATCALLFGCSVSGVEALPDGGGASTVPGQHALHVLVSGNGEVRASAPAFSCKSDCQQALDAGATVHLAAVATA